MSLLDGVQAEFWRAPRKRRLDWAVFGFGILEIGLTVAGLVGDQFLVLGAAFLLMGGAELVPEDRRNLSALLRVGAVGAFVAYGIAVILSV